MSTYLQSNPRNRVRPDFAEACFELNLSPSILTTITVPSFRDLVLEFYCKSTYWNYVKFHVGLLECAPENKYYAIEILGNLVPGFYFEA